MREVSWGTASSTSSVGGCFRFREASFARRAFRSVAAASREAWLEAMVLERARGHNSRRRIRGYYDSVLAGGMIGQGLRGMVEKDDICRIAGLCNKLAFPVLHSAMRAVC